MQNATYPPTCFVPSLAAPGQFLAVRILSPASFPLSQSETTLLQSLRPAEGQVWMMAQTAYRDPRWLIRLVPRGESPVEGYLVPADMHGEFGMPPQNQAQTQTAPPPPAQAAAPHPQAPAPAVQTRAPSVDSLASAPPSMPPWDEIFAEYRESQVPESESTDGSR